ncbi:PREDICTED: aladin [Ficedula albicollis]|uniref:aladin n=1 Tax=Ficedula albicollis TaxID=59894 RepID=UPI0007AD9580|nr:PREDICTED: aladin [Ficedula albicollis]
MCSLGLFPPPPPPGDVTLYELNNALVCGRLSEQLPLAFQSQVPQLPVLSLPKEPLKAHGRLEPSARPPFIHHRESLWKRCLGAWRDAGLCGLLRELASADEDGLRWLRTAPDTGGKWTPGLGSSAPRGARIQVGEREKGLDTVGPCWQLSVLLSLQLTSEDMIAAFSQAVDWAGCTVRAFAWHPHTNKFAVALLDDSIRVYNSSRWGFVPGFGQPGVGTALVLLPVASSHTWAHLGTPGLPFSPPYSFPTLGMPVPAQEKTLPAAPAAPQFGDRVGNGWAMGLDVVDSQGSRIGVNSQEFCSLNPVSCRVWEAQMWTCERWPTLRGRCQTGCWSPDGSRLLFSVLDESVIYSLSFSEYRGEMQGQVGGSKTASIVADLSETTFETLYGEERIGGEVHSMVWDPTGERLAVIIRGQPEAPGSQAAVAVFRTRNSPVFELLPCGFVRGERGAQPQLISFHPCFPQGALLTVCWSSGRISHIPFFFVSALEPRSPRRSPVPALGSVREQPLFSEL